MVKKLFSVFFILFSFTCIFAQNTPVLSNFRVEDSQKSRVYFDSSIPLSGTSATSNGFVISGKSISSITLSSDQTTGHYFTVSSAFNFWDNNTIRYAGGSNIGVHEFDLQYIKNNITEPSTSSDIYVDVNATGANNGTSPADAYTSFQAAYNSASAGTTIWVKAGTYGGGILMNSNATVTNPIKIIGYNDTDGIGVDPDIAFDFSTPETDPRFGNTANNQTNLDANAMPVFDGAFTESYVWRLQRSRYHIIKNIQITRGVDNGVLFQGSNESLHFENVIVKYGGRQTFDAFANGASGNRRVRFKNCVSYQDPTVTNGTNSVRYAGNFGMYDGFKIIANGRGGNYVNYLHGNNNIFKGIKMITTGTGQHGGLKGDGANCDYNLTVDGYFEGLTAPIQARGREIQFNVFRNLVVRDNATTRSNGVDGLSIWGGSDNIFDRIDYAASSDAIYFRQNVSNGVDASPQRNIIKNSIFRYVNTSDTSSGSAVTYYNPNAGLPLRDNQIKNCTFIGFSRFEGAGGAGTSNNEFINCHIGGFTRTSDANSIFTNCNFYGNSFSAPTGTSITEVAPLFVNEANFDFNLQETSPLRDSGLTDTEVIYDFEGVERTAPYSIGAHEYKVPKVGNVSPDVNICVGENTTLVASGGTSYSWNTGETTASITVNPSTTTTYTVTISDGTDSDSHDVEVTVNTPPSVNAGSDQTICEGENVTLTATGEGNFLWSTGETTASITVNPNTTTTYSVTASNSCSSDATDDVVVTVNPGVNLDAGSDVSICQGESVTLTATGTGPFNWSTGETTASITVNPSSTTTYSVTSDNGNCSDSDDVLVTVNTPPSVNAGSDQTICEGESVTLTATGEGNFLWSTGETTASITVNPNTTTTYSVTASNSCSSDATDDVVVTVNPGVNLDAGSDVSICQGESVTLTATGTGPFNWSTGETTASITVNPSSTTTYSVTSDNGSCSESDNVLVTVDSSPSVNAGSDQTICEGESVTLTATGEGNFLWSTGETTASITVSPSSTTTYSVTASNSCATDATDDVLITVNPGVTLDAGSDVAICQGESVTLTATGTGPFNWNTGETTASITVSPSNTTTYTVVSDNGNCSLTDDVEVTVNTPPTVNAGSDQTICEGDSVTLTASGEGDFLWSTGETTASITVNPSSTTTYSVTASSQGCQSTAVDYVEVVVGELPNLSTTSDVTITRGESIELIATGNGTFEWNTGETTPSITVSPIVTTSYTVTLTASGGCSEKNTIVVTVAEAADGGSVVAYAGEDATICKGDQIILTASGGEEYLWNTGETERSITVSPDQSTIFSVRVTKGEYSDTAYVKVNIDDTCSLEVVSEMMVYPNPARDLLNIDLLRYESRISIQLYSLNGTMVYSQEIDNNEGVSNINHKIDLSRLNKGVYLLRLSNKGKSETKKIIHI